MAQETLGTLERMPTLGGSVAAQDVLDPSAAAWFDDLLCWLARLEKVARSVPVGEAVMEQALAKLCKYRNQCEKMDRFAAFLGAEGIRRKTGDVVSEVAAAVRAHPSASDKTHTELLALRHDLEEGLWEHLRAAEEVLHKNAAALQSGELAWDEIAQSMRKLLLQAGANAGDDSGEEVEGFRFALKKAAWQAKADRDSPKPNQRYQARVALLNKMLEVLEADIADGSVTQTLPCAPASSQPTSLSAGFEFTRVMECTADPPTPRASQQPPKDELTSEAMQAFQSPEPTTRSRRVSLSGLSMASFASTPGSMASGVSSRRATRTGESRTTSFSEFYDYHLMGSPPPSPYPASRTASSVGVSVVKPEKRRTDSLSHWVEWSGNGHVIHAVQQSSPRTGAPSYHGHTASMTEANLSAISTQLELGDGRSASSPSRPVTPPLQSETASLPPGTPLSPSVSSSLGGPPRQRSSSCVKRAVQKLEQATQDHQRMSNTLRHWLNKESSPGQVGSARYHEYFSGSRTPGSSSRTPGRSTVCSEIDSISCASTPNSKLLSKHGLSFPWTPQAPQRRRVSRSTTSTSRGGTPGGQAAPRGAATAGTPQDVIAVSRRRLTRAPTPAVFAENEEVMEGSIPILVDSALEAPRLADRLESLMVLAKICWPPVSDPSEVDLCDAASKRFVARCDLLASTGKLPSIVSILKYEEEEDGDDHAGDEMRVAACRTITGAATSDLAADIIVNAGAPELLVEILCTSRNLELLEAAVVALLQVVGCHDERLLLCSTNCDLIHVLIDLMEAAKDHLGEALWESTAAAAAWLLHGLSVVGIEMGITVASEAGIEPAVTLMQGEMEELRMACVSLLGSLVDNCDGNGVRIVRANALPSLVRMLKGSQENLMLAQASATVIYGLVYAEGGRLHVTMAGGMDAFIDFLKDNPHSVIGWQGLSELLETPIGCQELLTLSDGLTFVVTEATSASAKLRFLHAGPAEPEAGEAPNNRLECAGLMASALRALTMCLDVVSKVVDAGAVPVLVELLGCSSRVCLEQSARALWNAVHLSAGRAALTESPKAVPHLLRAAQTGPAAARLCATKTLAVLAQDWKQRNEVWEAGGGVVLITMVEAGMTVELVEAAASALRTLALTRAHRREILRLGGIRALHSARAHYDWDHNLANVLDSTYRQLVDNSAGSSSQQGHSRREQLYE